MRIHSGLFLRAPVPNAGSALHRLPAWTKLILAAILALLALTQTSPAAQASLALFLFVLYAAARLGWRAMAQDAILFLLHAPLVLLVFLWRQGLEGVLPALQISARFTLALLPGLWVQRTTRVIDISRTLGRVLPPRLSFMLAMSLRLLPLLLRDVREIYQLQRLRGARIAPRELLHPLRWAEACHCLAVPLLMRTLQLADQVAVAARQRGFDDSGNWALPLAQDGGLPPWQPAASGHAQGRAGAPPRWISSAAAGVLLSLALHAMVVAAGLSLAAGLAGRSATPELLLEVALGTGAGSVGGAAGAGAGDRLAHPSEKAPRGSVLKAGPVAAPRNAPVAVSRHSPPEGRSAVPAEQGGLSPQPLALAAGGKGGGGMGPVSGGAGIVEGGGAGGGRSGRGGGGRELAFGSGEGPRFATLVRARYPRQARATGRQGLVGLRLSIDERGGLQGVEIVQSAGDDFDQAAIESVRASSYHPASRHGRAIACTALLRMRFTLSGQ